MVDVKIKRTLCEMAEYKVGETFQDYLQKKATKGQVETDYPSVVNECSTDAMKIREFVVQEMKTQSILSLIDLSKTMLTDTICFSCPSF